MMNHIKEENSKTAGVVNFRNLVSKRNPAIEGFSKQFSVNRGERIDFKIDSKKAGCYKIEIYRLGYYGGFGARRVAILNERRGKQQNSCEATDFEPGSKQCNRTVFPGMGCDVKSELVDCDEWEITDEWEVPCTAVTGVYLAYLDLVDSDKGNHILFIVRNDSARSDIMFKTSDATWQAYNRYKDRCFYPGKEGPTKGARVTAVSYNRPITQPAFSKDDKNGKPEKDKNGNLKISNDYFFQSEFRLLRWLERNGYNVKYCSSKDIAFSEAESPKEETDTSKCAASSEGNSLRDKGKNKVKILLSVGHDEYWSLKERRYFEAAREFGIHLCFFSGNECYWKTRWPTPTTLVCYKDGKSGDGESIGENCCPDKCDPNSWTGLWRNAPEPEPECALSGQISWVQTAQSHTISVPERCRKHPFWNNTEIQNGGGHKKKPGAIMDGLLGYEWNYYQLEFKDDGYPNGIVELSYAELRDDQWKIPNRVKTNDRPMKHSLTLYKHKSSESLVFAAGTTNFAIGLDNLYSGETILKANHDPGSTQIIREDSKGDQIDTNIQQATMNLLSYMGSDPTSMQDDLCIPVKPTKDWIKGWTKQ